MSISIADDSTQTPAETHEQDANSVSDPPPDSQASKKADLAGPGIGDYNELDKILPGDYNPLLNPKETQQAIFHLKRYIEDNLCKELSLMMVEVPLIVDAESRANRTSLRRVAQPNFECSLQLLPGIEHGLN